MVAVEVGSNDILAALESYEVRVDDFKNEVGWVVRRRILWVE
jgi:hypothetical protein